ncbi:SDR family oxidoreductase [Stappia indica]|uniref:SDR family oxidoreductase n=1 Tax=Stappia indica TaxID=538381 RepID=UPI001CD39A50|nr:SDR family oxidoreductase [Stappia indica]MCA1299260.1 SDR family oxidoreductase [Stappia indica]
MPSPSPSSFSPSRASSDAPIALVTGAARRIGKAIALDLARQGFAVAVHAHRSGAEAEAVVADIRAEGGKAEVVAADLTDPQAPARLIGEIGAALGPLRLLVNSASIFQNDDIASLSPDLYDAHFAIHARAPVFLASAFAAQVPVEGDALIVNIIDQRVWKLTPQFLSYTLSKSALWAATQTLAQGLAPRIRVNAIGPGPTLANIRQTQEDFERQAAAVPLGRGPDLDDFGRTISYLWATPSITGQMIALDGGQHLAWETPDVAGMRE